MTGPIRRFDPSELHVPGEPPPTTAEQADAMLAARELEAAASAATVRPSDGFEDRVMAAIATEPAPRLVARPSSSVRGGLVGSFLATIRDAWGVATTSGRPIAVRAQALAFVLLVGVAATAFAGVGALGVGALLDRDQTPAPSVQPGPTESSAPSAQPSPSPTAEPSVSPSPSASATESAEPTETAEATETPEPTETDEAETPRPTKTPRPTETPEGTDDHSGSGGGGDDSSGSGGSGSGGDSDD